MFPSRLQHHVNVGQSDLQRTLLQAHSGSPHNATNGVGPTPVAGARDQRSAPDSLPPIVVRATCDGLATVTLQIPLSADAALLPLAVAGTQSAHKCPPLLTTKKFCKYSCWIKSDN